MNIGTPRKRVIVEEEPAPVRPREIPTEKPQPSQEPAPLVPSKTKEEVRVE